MGLLTLGIYWSVKAYKDWQDNLVLTTVKTTAYSIKNIDFPALTICGPGDYKNYVNVSKYRPNLT
jgi:hypothetical protein